MFQMFKGIVLVFRDWKALLLHQRGRIALGFLCLVPLIYAGFFLAGYWNPYGKLDQLPVAVVNEDQGAEFQGLPIHAGEDFVRELHKNKELNYHFVPAVDAKEGLKSGRYYMTITVPADFSSNVGTLMNDHPQPARLQYATNAGTNFVASQVGSTAVKEMKAKIDASIIKSYSDGVFTKMEELAKGLSDAGSGARSLNQGTVAAKDGMTRLSDGIRTVTGGASRLQEGSAQLAAGEHKLQQGMNGLADGTGRLAAGMDQLHNGEHAIEAGSSRISSGMNSWMDANRREAQGQEQAALSADGLHKELADYIAQHPDAAKDEKLQHMLKTAEGLASGMGNLAAGQSKLAQSAQTLNNGQRDAVQGLQVFGAKLQQAAAGAHQLSAASSQMQSGMDKWETGFVHFSAGVHALANGGQQLDHGADQLMNGLIRLNDGTGELSGKLTDAAQKTSGIHANDALSSMFSDPVKLEESQMTHVPNYGSGIAPYFLCLALFVGGIMGANILPLARRPELKITGSTHFVNKLGLFYSIGVIQTAIVDAIVLYGFKLHVTSVPQFLLFTLLVSFTFLTLIHMLVNLFGFIGKFASVTLLILQLATCGGTFPVELMSPVMRAIGQCLPMTYALRGLQQVISLGDAKQMADNAVILLGYMIGAALLGLLANLLQHEKQARAAAAQ